MKKISEFKGLSSQSLNNNIFVDREEARQHFWDNYNNINRNDGEWPITILNYYGISGIGKTNLCKKLEEEIGMSDLEIKYIHYSFKSNSNVLSTLYALRNLFTNKYNFEFPMFDMAYVQYAVKSGDLTKENEIESIISSSKFLSGIIAVADVTPKYNINIISAAFKCIDLCVVGIREVLNKNKSELQKMDNSIPEEILSRLPVLFAKDLNNQIITLDNPIVVILDNYENLVNELSDIGNPLYDDLWLRGNNGIILNIPNVVWILCGQEQLKWNDMDTEWEDSIKPFVLETLKEPYARDYLEIYGVKDEELITQLCVLTDGMPIYLYLCVEIYFSILNNRRIPSIADFGTVKTELVNRYVHQLNTEEQTIISLLSCLDVWSDNLIEELLEGLKLHNMKQYYKKIKRKSYIQAESGVYEFSLHSTVAKVIFESFADKDIIKECMLFLEEKLFTSNVNLDFINKKLYLSYIKCKLKTIDNYDDMLDFVTSRKFILGYLIEKKDLLFFKSCYELVSSKISLEYKNTFISGAIMYMYARYLFEIGEFQLTIKKSKIAWNTLKNNGGNADLCEDVKNLMAQAYDSLSEFTESYIIRREILESRIRLYGENAHSTISMFHNIAVSYIQQKEYEKALPILSKVYEARNNEKIEDKIDLYKIVSVISTVFYELDDTEYASKWCKRAIKLSDECFGKEHINSLSARRDLYKIELKQKSFVSSRELFFILDKFNDTLGKDAPETIDTLYDCTISALCDRTSSERGAILENLNSIHSYNMKKYGETHSRTLGNIMEKAIYYSMEGDHIKSRDILLDLYNKLVEQYGSDHDLVWKVAHNLSIEYLFLGNIDDANNYFNIYKNLYGQVAKDRQNLCRKYRDTLGK